MILIYVGSKQLVSLSCVKTQNQDMEVFVRNARAVTNNNPHDLVQLTSQMSSEEMTRLVDKVTLLLMICLDLCNS